MAKTKLFKLTTFLLLVIAALYFLEIKFYLTWTIWWYDMVLHFLAGVIMGTGTLLIFQNIFDFRLSYYFKVVLIAIIVSFLVGMLWEILELNLDLTSFSDGMAYIRDTTSDLILDMAGAIFGVSYGIKIWKKN